MSPDEKFGPMPDRFDQVGSYERGYRDGYHAARTELMELFLKRNPLTDVQGGCVDHSARRAEN